MQCWAWGGCGFDSDVRTERKDVVHRVTGGVLYDSVSGLGKRAGQEGMQRTDGRFGDGSEFWTGCMKNV